MTKRFKIETSRLLLREWTDADAADIFELNNDLNVLRYTGDEPFSSVEEAQLFIGQYPDYRVYGMGRWVMIDKNLHQFIGWCGLKYLPALQEIDLGYRLSQRFWNKGYATEAAMACLRFGFESLQLQRVIGRAMKANTASVRVLEKCGLIFEKEMMFEEHEGLCYAAAKDEWMRKFV